MAEKRYYWLKLKDDFFKQKEIKKLRKIAGGDTYTIIYLKLQLLSLKTDGILVFDGIEDTIIEELALELDEEVENINITWNYLKRYGIVEQINDEQYLLPRTIALIGSETLAAERVRRHRDNKKALQCNATVTIGNTPVTIGNIDIDIDKNLDIDIKKSYQKKFSDDSFEMKCVNYLINSIKAEMPSAKLPSTDKDIDKWCEHIEKMVRLDKRNPEYMYSTLQFARENSFWKTNIRSTRTFREKYETLYTQMKNHNEHHNKTKASNQFNNFPQREYDMESMEQRLLHRS